MANAKTVRFASQPRVRLLTPESDDDGQSISSGSSVAVTTPGVGAPNSPLVAPPPPSGNIDVYTVYESASSAVTRAFGNMYEQPDEPALRDTLANFPYQYNVRGEPPSNIPQARLRDEAFEHGFRPSYMTLRFVAPNQATWTSTLQARVHSDNETYIHVGDVLDHIYWELRKRVSEETLPPYHASYHAAQAAMAARGGVAVLNMDLLQPHDRPLYFRGIDAQPGETVWEYVVNVDVIPPA